jgi:hypothetical protein
MLKSVLFGSLAVAVLCSVLWARQGVVHLTDGSEVSGDIDDHDPNVVSVTSHGIRATVPRDQVALIEYPGNLDDEFNLRMARLAPYDVAGRLTTARWAMEKRRFDLARRAVADAMAIDRTNPEALELMRTIDYEQSLPMNAPTTSPSTLPIVLEPIDKRYLTPRQINEMRQLELQKVDAGFRVTFRDDVRNRYLAHTAGEPRAFYSQELSDQARQILAYGDAEMTRDIIIQSDPASMVDYRRRIQPILMGGCAISGCHDARTHAAHFGLFTHDESPAVAYTNYYLLQTYATHGKARHSFLIDRNRPENSLLLDYGLPLQTTVDAHPYVRDMRQTYTGRNDPHYKEMLYWIGTILAPDGGRYPDISYQPPWEAPATQPIQP